MRVLNRTGQWSNGDPLDGGYPDLGESFFDFSSSAQSIETLGLSSQPTELRGWGGQTRPIPQNNPNDPDDADDPDVDDTDEDDAASPQSNELGWGGHSRLVSENDPDDADDSDDNDNDNDTDDNDTDDTDENDADENDADENDADENDADETDADETDENDADENDDPPEANDSDDDDPDENSASGFDQNSGFGQSRESHFDWSSNSAEGSASDERTGDDESPSQAHASANGASLDGFGGMIWNFSDQMPSHKESGDYWFSS